MKRRTDHDRLKTTMWTDKSGLHLKKNLTFLKRKCVGYNVVDEDAKMAGAEAVLERIENLANCADGVYEVVVVNEKRDWESGYVEDWDYGLIPVKEKVR
jgi:hypothetical protein